MSENVYSHPELKLTAILYANNPNVVEHLKRAGKLPEDIPDDEFATGLPAIIETGGLNPDLSETEKLVYEAILWERYLSGGGVRLVEEAGYR